MECLKLAFVGGGLNSAIGLTHKIASQMDNRFQLVAGCFSRDPDINEKTRQLWGVPRCYPDPRSLLEGEQGETDVVAVLTPTPAHAGIVEEALEMGYPVICEKAVAASVADAERIAEAVRRGRRYLAVTYNYTGYPMVRELRSLIRSNRLGRIQQVHVEMPQDSFLRRDAHGNPMPPQAWRLRDGSIPTLSLDLGVHVHNLIWFLVGEKPIRTVAVERSLGHFPVIDNTISIVEYTGGLICSLWYSKVALGYRNGLRVRVFGERGAAEWIQMHPEILRLGNEKGELRTIDRGSHETVLACHPRYNRFKAGHPAGFIEAFANLYADIAGSIADFRQSGHFTSEYVFGIEHAIEGLQLMDAITRSARSGRWETVG